MRLFLIVANLKGGGVQRVICNLATKAYARGVDVRVIALTRLQDGHLEFGAVPVEVIGKKSVKSSVVPLKRLLSDAREGDCILTGQPHANTLILAIASGTKSKARIFVSEHNPLDIALTFKERVIQKLKWQFYPRSSGIICVGKEIEYSLRKRPGFHDHPIVTINNPVVPPQTPSARAVSDMDKPYNVICVGRLHPQKNFELAIETVQELQQDGKNVRLRIFGEGAERKKLEKVAKDRLIPNSYALEGFKDDIYAVLAESDCLLVTSRWEGFGIVIVEAMYCGVNVVSTRCSGPCEILADGIFGKVTDSSPVALAAAVKQVMAHPKDAEILKNRARDISDPDRVFDRYWKFFQINA